MIDELKLDKIIKFAKKHHPAKSIHDWKHVLSVVATALYLGKKEKADIDVLLVSAYLHDIGYRIGTKENHNEKSVELAKPFLEELNFDDKFISKVIHAILHHKVSWAKKTKNKEARILCDADKIDQLGAFGFLRIVRNRLLYRKEELYDAIEIAEQKNTKIYKTLFTKSAKEMVKKECDYIKKLCNDFNKRKRLIESI